MTRDEVAALVARNYTLFGVAMPPDEALREIVLTWEYYFRGYDAKTVQKAFLDAAADSDYLVTPSKVFRQLALNGESRESQWQQILAARKVAEKVDYCRRYPLLLDVSPEGKKLYFDGEKAITEAFSRLPEEAQKWLGGVSGLMDLARLGENDLLYRRAEFMKVDVPVHERARLACEQPTRHLTGKEPDVLRMLSDKREAAR